MTEPVKSEDLFKTDTPVTGRGKATYDTIAARLAAFEPKIVVGQHVAYIMKKGKKISSLEANDSTLDGINFVPVNSKKLASDLEGAKDQWGQKALASVKEDPDHWAVKLSFGATPGTGWREEWRRHHTAPQPQYWKSRASPTI